MYGWGFTESWGNPRCLIQASWDTESAWGTPRKAATLASHVNHCDSIASSRLLMAKKQMNDNEKVETPKNSRHMNMSCTYHFLHGILHTAVFWEMVLQQGVQTFPEPWLSGWWCSKPTIGFPSLHRMLGAQFEALFGVHYMPAIISEIMRYSAVQCSKHPNCVILLGLCI